MPDLNSSRSLVSCLEFYLEDCLARGETNRTVEGKQSNLKLFIKWCLAQGVDSIDECTFQLAEEYRRYLNKYRIPVKNKPLELGTLKNRLNAVKVFFARLYYHKIIPSDPTAKLMMPKVPKRLTQKYFSPAEANSVINQAKLNASYGLRDVAILEVLYATGIRRMELANLKISDIDTDKGVLSVYQGKGRKDRRVPIAPRALTAIEEYLHGLRPRLATINAGEYLFLNNQGQPFQQRRLSYLVSKYVKQSPVKIKGSCNLFRHTTATLMHENGADIRHVQAMMGHADISTTQIYTHVAIPKLKEVYRKTHPCMIGS